MEPLAAVPGSSDPASVPTIPASVAARIVGAVELSRSAGTRRAYASGWRRYTEWCTRNGHFALPAHPVTVAAYLVDAADTLTAAGEKAYAASTLSARVAAINHYNRTAGHPQPSAHELVATTLAGIRRD